jgi:hypothetical protein
MKILKHLTLLLFMLSSASFTFAHEKQNDFGETMRSNGRIYVVVAVMVTILLGLIIYLVRLDRKISKIEKEN